MAVYSHADGQLRVWCSVNSPKSLPSGRLRRQPPAGHEGRGDTPRIKAERISPVGGVGGWRVGSESRWPVPRDLGEIYHAPSYAICQVSIRCGEGRMRALLSQISSGQRISQENKCNPSRSSALIGPCLAGVEVGFYLSGMRVWSQEMEMTCPSGKDAQCVWAGGGWSQKQDTVMRGCPIPPVHDSLSPHRHTENYRL